MLRENVFISFLRKFDQYPFRVILEEGEWKIGESIALGEAYMDGDLEIKGDLYFALDHFLGQMGTFSTDESLLKKIMDERTISYLWTVQRR